MLPRLPRKLVAYIEQGGEVRNQKTDPCAGRCGAQKEKPSGPSPYCQRLAGLNTKHKGVGRCATHEDQYDTGLAPWVGEINEEDWLKITGGQVGQPGAQGIQPTHAATAALKPFEKIMAERLSPEDLDSYLNAPTDPMEVINANLRERHMAKDRIYRYLQRVKVRADQAKSDVLERLINAQQELSALVEQPLPEDKAARAKLNDQAAELTQRIGHLRADARQLDHYADTCAIEVEPTLNKVTGIMARLLEVKARYHELEGTEETRNNLLEIFRTLNDDQFARLKNDPVAMGKMLASYGGLQS